MAQYLFILVFNDGRVFDVHVSREPKIRFQDLQQLLSRRTSQFSLANLIPEVLFDPQQGVQIAVTEHFGGPIVGQHDVRRIVLQLLHAEKVHVPLVVN